MSSLRPEDYADDELVCIQCSGREVWLSERLFRRLMLIGRAYELHLLPLLEQDTTLNSVQADSLLGELDFIRTVVADAAITSVLNELAPLVRTCRVSPDRTISFEWP